MTDADDRTSILIVDDHALVRQGLREILRTQSDLVVVAEAGDSARAVALAAEKRPHVVLLDIEIPGDDVTTTVARIRSLSPNSQVIILSMYEGPQLLQSLLAVGIRGYLLKTVSWQDLVAAIRTVRAGRGHVVLELSPSSLRNLQGPPPVALSEREREVLELTAEALSNGQIAARLNLTEATVKRHLHNIFAKLEAVSRIDAVNKATAASLITPKRAARQTRAAERAM